MNYATVAEVQAGFRTLSNAEQTKCAALLNEADILIDTYNEDADTDKKRLVECRMVRRVLGSGDDAMFPMGANQGTQSALGYSQTWSLGSGTTGELYMGKEDKRLLGVANRIGASNPLGGDSHD